MTLTPRLAAEAFKVAKDAGEDRRTRAAALMLTLGPAAEFHQIRDAAVKNSVAALYDELTRGANDLMVKLNEAWAPKAAEVDACVNRLKERIRKATVVWVIHGGASGAWKDVGRQIERDMGLRYVEFNDPHDAHVLVNERVATMGATATFAVAVMSAEDSQPGGKVRARQNVLHEIGLAQGLLGLDRVIVMREQGIEDFTNMSGWVYVSFTAADVEAALPRLQRELEARLY